MTPAEKALREAERFAGRPLTADEVCLIEHLAGEADARVRGAVSLIKIANDELQAAEEQLAALHEAKMPPITQDQVEAAIQAATEAMEYATNGDPELDIEYKKAWAAVRAALTVLGYYIPKEEK